MLEENKRSKEDIEKLINENKKLVPYIVYRKYGYYINKTCFEDILQEGDIALWYAAKTYEESRKIAFSTYACAIIDSRIMTFLNRWRGRTNHKSGILKRNSEHIPIDGINFNGGRGFMIQKSIISEQGLTAEELEVILVYNQFYNSLNDKERKLVDYRKSGLSQTDIAKEYNCSQVHISRRLTKLKNKLKDMLGGKINV